MDFVSEKMFSGDEANSAAQPSQQPSDENSNPNLSGPATVHGGGVAKNQRSDAEPNHGGGVASPQHSTVSSGQGTASDVQLSNVLVPPGVAVHPHQAGGTMSVFNFTNPFDGAAAAGTGVQLQAQNLVASLPSNDSAAPSGSQPEHDRRAGDAVCAKNFSEMSAEDLFQVLVSKITTLQKEFWIQEDLSGAVFIEHVEPSVLGETPIRRQNPKIQQSIAFTCVAREEHIKHFILLCDVRSSSAACMRSA